MAAAAADVSDELLQEGFISGGGTSTEITEELWPASDGAGSPGIDGGGASWHFLLARVDSGESYLSSSPRSSSYCSDIESDVGDRHPQSEIEEIASPRWLPRCFNMMNMASALPCWQIKYVFIGRMKGENNRRKALRVAVKLPGVLSAAIEGADMNQIVVIGDRVDCIDLVRTLRKQMGFADIVSMGPVEKREDERDVKTRILRQKVVIRVQMQDDDKKRRKAMKVAVELPGVLSVAMHKSQIVVIGDGVDSVALKTSLRKHLGSAVLVTVAAVEEKKETKREVKEEEEEEKPVMVWPGTHCNTTTGRRRDPYQDPGCSAM